MPADNKCNCSLPHVFEKENRVLGSKISIRLCCVAEEMSKTHPGVFVEEDIPVSEKWEDVNPAAVDWENHKRAYEEAKGMISSKNSRIRAAYDASVAAVVEENEKRAALKEAAIARMKERRQVNLRIRGEYLSAVEDVKSMNMVRREEGKVELPVPHEPHYLSEPDEVVKNFAKSPDEPKYIPELPEFSEPKPAPSPMPDWMRSRYNKKFGGV